MNLKTKYLSFTQKILMALLLLSCASIWLPIAFLSVFMSLFIIVWLISGDYSNKFKLIKENPAAFSAIALLILYLIGITYSSAGSNAAFTFGAKYHKLLFIPMIVSTLRDDKTRKLALNVFLGASIVILALSYLKWFGLFNYEHHGGNQGNVIFKGRIAHSIFMSFAMYLMINYSFKSEGYKRLLWFLLSLLAAFNIFYLVNGRTGQITMLVIVFWFSWEVWRSKSLVCWAVIVLLGAGIHMNYPNFPSSRLTETKVEMSQGLTSSAGQRVAMYQNTLSLIQKHLILGGGTGSLEGEYKSLAESQHSQLLRVPNPHNQYLLTTQELGIIGLVCLLWMGWTQWRVSNKTKDGYILRGLIVTIAVGSLFNSLLLDAAEGQFYCILAGILLSAYSPNNILNNHSI